MLNRQYLSALLYFERAAAHQSFALAAEEMHVTRSAISHRINVLEHMLNVRLFTRTTRQVRLTQEGQDLLDSTQQGFRLLREGQARVAHELELRVSLGSYLSSQWLMSRLASFESQFPGIRIRLEHQAGLPSSNTYDLAIVWVDRRRKIQNSTVLFDSPAFPVAAPQALSVYQGKEIFTDDSLPAIHYQSRKSWQDWLQCAGLADHYAKTGDVYKDPNLVLEAAIHGRGIALGYLPFIQKYLKEGQLVKVSELDAPASNHYRLISHNIESDDCRKFTEWLIDEAKLSQ